MNWNRELGGGAALAGAVLVALPLLDVLLSGGGEVAVRAIVGGCGIALLTLSASSWRGKERA